MKAKQTAREAIDDDDLDDDVDTEDPADEGEPLEASDDTDDEEPKPSRKEKKQYRGRIRNLETELEDERRRRRELEESAHYASVQRIATGGQVQQQQKDPLEDEIDALYDKKVRFQEEYSAVTAQRKLTDAEHAKYTKEAIELDKQIQRANARAAGAGHQQQVDPNQMAGHVRLQAFMEKNQDVYSHHDRIRVNGQMYPRAAVWADTRYKQLLTEGYPPTEETAGKAVEEARQRFLKGGSAPSRDSARERFSGPPRSSNGQTGGRVTVQMNSTRKRLAEAMFPSMKPEQAWQKWANGPGKRRAEKTR